LEVIFAIQGKDFVVTAADALTARSIVVMKRGADKTKVLNSKTMMVYSGEAGDTVQFSEYIEKNIKLYSMRNGFDLSCKSVAAYVRRELATSLRSRNPYQINVLIAGMTKDAAELYWIDYISNMVKLPFASHGYASYFIMSTMDRYWKPNMSLEEVLKLVEKCRDELRTRFIANLPEFVIKIVDKDGIRQL
ncbi:nucleophile aminohydrolase, partial [Gorgonomyces haynaldii]